MTGERDGRHSHRGPPVNAESMPHAQLVIETAHKLVARAAEDGLAIDDILVVVVDAADPGSRDWALGLLELGGLSREEASALLIRSLTASAERGHGTLAGSYLELSTLRVRGADAPPLRDDWRELVERAFPPRTGRLVY